METTKTEVRLMDNNNKKTADFLKPPSSVNDEALKVFSERYVRMCGHDYYLRVFTDGTSEFTRFDRDTGKWVFLVFPATKSKNAMVV